MSSDRTAAERKREQRLRDALDLRLVRSYPTIAEHALAELIRAGVIPDSVVDNDKALGAALDGFIEREAEFYRAAREQGKHRIRFLIDAKVIRALATGGPIDPSDCETESRLSFSVREMLEKCAAIVGKRR